MKMLEIVDLGKCFRSNWVIDSANVFIKKGEVFGLLGPNGAGKTTLIRMLCTLIRPSKGTALIAGLSLGPDNSCIRKLIGLVPENSGFYERLSALENITFHLGLQGYSKQYQKSMIDEYFDLMRLSEYRNKTVGTFSKGLKQRLAIVRALIHNPKIVFLDEPTSGLDVESAVMVRNMIDNLSKRGVTIILCTHNMDEAEHLCNRVAVFNKRVLRILDIGKVAIGDHLWVDYIVPDVNSTVLRGITNLPGVEKVQEKKNGFRIWITDPGRVNPSVVNYLVNHGCNVVFIEENRPHLEQVYLELLNDVGSSNENFDDNIKRVARLAEK